MNNVYLVQVDVASGAECKTVYLPYAAGLLAAFAWQDSRIREQYAFRGFVFERKPIDAVIEDLEDPCVVGFSCYVWTRNITNGLQNKSKNAIRTV
jgi:catabolite regulation protein CreA